MDDTTDDPSREAAALLRHDVVAPLKCIETEFPNGVYGWSV